MTQFRQSSVRVFFLVNAAAWQESTDDQLNIYVSLHHHGESNTNTEMCFSLKSINKSNLIIPSFKLVRNEKKIVFLTFSVGYCQRHGITQWFRVWTQRPKA